MIWEIINQKYKYSNTTTVLDNDLLDPVEYTDILLILIPIVCLFSVITNGLNILVFLHSKMKDSTFKYMLAISVSNLLYAGLLSYGYIVYCEDCSLSKSYGTQLFKIWIEYYFTSCLAFFSILIEIVISIHRYFLLKNNNNFLSKTSFKWITPMLLLISLLFYIPVIFTYEIVPVQLNDTIIYSKVRTSFGRTNMGRSFPIIQSLTRIFLSTFILSVVNVANIIGFRQRFKKKIQLKLKNLVAEEQSGKIFRIFKCESKVLRRYRTYASRRSTATIFRILLSQN